MIHFYSLLLSGIDTACQPRHYNEPGVGLAVKKLIDEGFIKRSDLFLQTKYTPIGGQDPNNIPYDPSQPIEIQVEQSFQKSLSNLHTDYLDSLILHSPLAKISGFIFMSLLLLLLILLLLLLLLLLLSLLI